MSAKTERQIINDVVSRLKAGGLESVITGRIYKRKRRKNSQLEDCVVKLKTGSDGQIQRGTVTINIWVKDVVCDIESGDLDENSPRLDLLATTLNTICRSFTTGEYLFTPANIVETWEEEAIKQHFIHLDLDFKRTSITLKNQ